MLTKIYYWWYRRKYEVPHPNEIADFKNSSQYEMDSVTRIVISKWFKIGSMYALGATIPELTEMFGVTRERVRQCIMKFYRRYK